MIYVGVDIAKSEHCLCAIDADGRVVQRPKRFRQDATGWAELAALLTALGGPTAVTIGFEATGHYWVLLAEELVRLGYRPQVFNPILSADAGRTTVRGRKTDEDDCLVISTVLRDGRFNPVRLPEAGQGELKRLTRHRQGLAERCANQKKHLIALLDLTFPEFSDCFSDAYCTAARALLAKAPSARLIATLGVTALAALLKKHSRSRLGRERAEDLIRAAKTSIAARRTDTASEFAIRQTVAEIAMLSQQIAACNAEIRRIDVPGLPLITTIPGIARILGAVILAEIGTISAFERHPGDTSTADPVHRLLAFAGLDPRIRTSGAWTGKTRMSKRGSKTLRTAIWRAAFVASRHPAFAGIYLLHRKTMKQHQKVALSHVARKIVQAIYGVLHYQKPFDAGAFRHGVKKPQQAA